MLKPVFYMLVGVPSSGKTTWALEHEDEKTIVLSSDALREELFGDVQHQDDNDVIFNTLNKRTKECLKKGYNVIYDATNINSKKRMGLLSQLRGLNIIRKCIIFAVPIELCKDYNRKRDKKVPTSVISKMFKNFQIPMYFEGWNEIEIVSDEKHFLPISPLQQSRIDINGIFSYEDYIDILKEDKDLMLSVELAQDSSYHTLSVSRHMYYAFKDMCLRTDDEYLRIASLFHDIGKPYCKNFKEGARYANFVRHDNVGSYLLMLYLLRYKGYTDNEIIRICTYVQLHDRLLNKQANQEKFMNKIGIKLYKELEMLTNSDRSAK
jgi:putative nucleotidyltransferase with HDIG domain